MRITIAYEAWHFDIFLLDELNYSNLIEKLNSSLGYPMTK